MSKLYGMNYKIVAKKPHCVLLMGITNRDFEPFDSVNELINEDEKFLTFFIYNPSYNCLEPYDGCNMLEQSKVKKVREDALKYFNN